jgi:quinol monooxygenase YgiN
MVVEYIRYRIKNHATDNYEASLADFEAAYAEAAKVLDASPHCLGYQLARCVEEPDRYTLRIEWDSIDGHLLGFRREAGWTRFFDAIKPYLSEIEEMQHYMPTAIASEKGSAAR